MTSVVQNLKSRKLIHNISHEEELEKLLSQKSVTFYCGFDPTADSLHVGSLAALLLMRRLQKAGHTPIVVLGSATGMIGDPSGKSAERKLLTNEELQKNLAGIEKPVRLLLSDKGKNAYKIVKNSDWINSLSSVDFLRDVGKHFSVNMMLGKESVRERLENREQGISYTEFSYMLLQAYDFYWLHKNNNCTLQVGGSDQWGNITAGIELIRRKSEGKHQAFGFTFPLVTTSSGTKFGKTEAGSVWLDAEKTSPYHFYQFWLNTPDSDVIRFFEIFTDVTDDELAIIQKGVQSQPEKREAQKQLAFQMTELIHGKSEAKKSVQASQALFGESIKQLDKKTLLAVLHNVPSHTLSRGDFQNGMPLTDLLVKVELAKSRGEARRLIDGGGIYLNNEKVTDNAQSVDSSAFIEDSLLVLRSGKKNYRLVELG